MCCLQGQSHGEMGGGVRTSGGIRVCVYEGNHPSRHQCARPVSISAVTPHPRSHPAALGGQAVTGCPWWEGFRRGRFWFRPRRHSWAATSEQKAVLSLFFIFSTSFLHPLAADASLPKQDEKCLTFLVLLCWLRFRWPEETGNHKLFSSREHMSQWGDCVFVVCVQAALVKDVSAQCWRKGLVLRWIWTTEQKLRLKGDLVWRQIVKPKFSVWVLYWTCSLSVCVHMRGKLVAVVLLCTPVILITKSCNSQVFWRVIITKHVIWGWFDLSIYSSREGQSFNATVYNVISQWASNCLEPNITVSLWTESGPVWCGGTRTTKNVIWLWRVVTTLVCSYFVPHDAGYFTSYSKHQQWDQVIM